MKKDRNTGYKKFKKALILLGLVAAFAVLHAILFILIPFIKETHGF